MTLVVGQREIGDTEIAQILYLGIELHSGQRIGCASELQTHLIEMIGVDMGIAKGMYKSSRLQTGNLSGHQKQQGITGNIERHT